MAESIPRQIPESTPEILARIKEVGLQARRSESELARVNIELGSLFIRLKERAAGTWQQKLERLGYSPRVVSRLMKAAKTLASPDGVVSEHLRERLPADPIKLETLCALPLTGLERLIKEHDCRQLDRGEITALVRVQQGKKEPGEKKPLSPADAIRQGWAKSVEGMLKKLSKLEPEEREELVRFLDDNLDDLKLSLQEPEAQDEEEPEEGEEGMEADDREIREPADEGDEKSEQPEEDVEEEGREHVEEVAEAKPAVKLAPPKPSAQKPSDSKTAGGRRAKPVTV